MIRCKKQASIIKGTYITSTTLIKTIKVFIDFNALRNICHYQPPSKRKTLSIAKIKVVT